MILDDDVKMKVHNTTAKIYKRKGYDIPMKIGSKGKLVYDTDKYILVKVKDLEPTCTVLVNTMCDICHKEKIMHYNEYQKQLDEYGLRTCIKCKKVKTKRTILKKYGSEENFYSQLNEKIKKSNREKYGVDWYLSTEDAKNKREKTNIEKHGYKYPMQDLEIREKTKNTNILRYGYDNPTKNKEVLNKMYNTMIERYGAAHGMQIPDIKSKIEQTNILRYGHKCSLGSKEIYSKARISRFKHGTTATSSQQKYICNLYNGILNKACSSYNLDIALNNLDIEYDGGGHDLQVVLGQETSTEFKTKQIIRDKIIKSNGYKIIRFISKSDKLPTDDILIYILNFSKEYFNTTNHTWIEWYFDENMYRNAIHKDGVYFNYGHLSRVKT